MSLSTCQSVREGTCLLVLCSNEEDSTAQFDKTNYSLMIDDHEMTCKKLLFTVDKDIVTENCIQWGIDEFVRYTGEAVLADILGRELALDLTPAKAKKPAASAQAESSQKDEPGVTIPHFPVKLTEQAAIRAAGVQGTARLRFIPYFLIHYVSSGEQVYKDRRIPFDAEGYGAINAINGIKLELDGKAGRGYRCSRLRRDCRCPHPERRSERAHGDRAIHLAHSEGRIKQEKGDAIFYEEKVLKPDRKNIAVETKMVYIPVWQIRGKKIVEVNAFTGELLSEPMDEGVEVF